MGRSSAEEPLKQVVIKICQMVYWEEIKLKTITEQEAKDILSERGHKNWVTVTFPKNDIQHLHEHPFDVDLVVVSGNIKIVVGDKEYNLTSGDEFQLGAGIEHSEFMGENEVVLVSARPEKTES